MQYMDVSKTGVYPENEYVNAEHDDKQVDFWSKKWRRVDDQKPKSLLIQSARMTFTKAGLFRRSKKKSGLSDA